MNVKSSKPKKQRKFFHEMGLHKKQKSVSSTLSKSLRKSMGKRSLPLRKGDRVKVLRGKNRKFEGKVLRVDYIKMQVFLEKLVRKKSDGTEKPIPLHASNMMIVDLDKSDVRRAGKERGKKVKRKVKEDAKEKKPAEEKKEAKEEVKEKKEKVEKKTKTEEKKEKVKKDGEKGRKKKPKKA